MRACLSVWFARQRYVVVYLPFVKITSEDYCLFGWKEEKNGLKDNFIS